VETPPETVAVVLVFITVTCEVTNETAVTAPEMVTIDEESKVTPPVTITEPIIFVPTGRELAKVIALEAVVPSI
jgi:hypothetical protein